jgi:sugar O-acyltransferase (sialic acid O-acetyltransferase NeuD family)
MKKVVIYGTGLLAEVIHFYLIHDSDYEVIAFTVEEKFMDRKEFCGRPIVPFEEVNKFYPPETFGMFIAVSYQQVNKIRARLYYEAKKKGYRLISYVSSKTICWGEIRIGENCFIFEQQTIQPFVKIGNNVIIWSGNHIGHHVTIGDHCFISSHVVISGKVQIKPYCFLGVNATIRNGIVIEEENVIGAGAVILKSTVKKGVYVSSPARLFLKDSSKLKSI